MRRSRFLVGVMVVSLVDLGVVWAQEAAKPMAGPAPKQSLEARFRELDTDGDGAVSREELLANVAEDKRKEWTRDFQLLDFDFDGRLSLDEYRNVPGVAPRDQRGPVPDPIVDRMEKQLAELSTLLKHAGNGSDSTWSRREWPEERVAGRHYRLPTEAEWEYACRSGTSKPYRWRPARQPDDLSGKAAGIQPALPIRPVGSYPPNAFGLCDMRGNAWEWCADWFDRDYYLRSPTDDPQGPPSGYVKVVRGGDWRFIGEPCHIDYPVLPPWKSNPVVGFRVACETFRKKPHLGSFGLDTHTYGYSVVGWWNVVGGRSIRQFLFARRRAAGRSVQRGSPRALASWRKIR